MSRTSVPFALGRGLYRSGSLSFGAGWGAWMLAGLVLELLASQVCAFLLVRKEDARSRLRVAGGGSEAAAQRMEQGFQDGGDLCPQRCKCLLIFCAV
jgi:hypothetical protein